jgi:hypothetical protein
LFTRQSFLIWQTAFILSLSSVSLLVPIPGTEIYCWAQAQSQDQMTGQTDVQPGQPPLFPSLELTPSKSSDTQSSKTQPTTISTPQGTFPQPAAEMPEDPLKNEVPPTPSTPLSTEQQVMPPQTPDIKPASPIAPDKPQPQVPSAQQIIPGELGKPSSGQAVGIPGVKPEIPLRSSGPNKLNRIKLLWASPRRPPRHWVSSRNRVQCYLRA